MKAAVGSDNTNLLLVDRRSNALYVYGVYDDNKDVPHEFSGLALLALSRESSSKLPTIFSAVTRRNFYRRRRRLNRKENRENSTTRK